ncbi:hypothetical protein C8R44DRAFT_821165 [Mycena epipterygia]|nr:hypothetical protein C8R44DRAFT_821165 [Mycena epipterygia]
MEQDLGDQHPRRYSFDTLVDDGSEISSSLVTFVPIPVEGFNRYGRGRCIENAVTEYIVPPASRSFSRKPIAEWIPHQHPEGALYFMHPKTRTFTDANLYDDVVLARIMSCIAALRLKKAKASLEDFAQNVDVVLDINEDEPENIKCGYYFVDHSSRIPFWLDEFNMSQLSRWEAVPGIVSESHVHLGLQIEYWRHCDLFPSAFAMSPDLIQGLRDTIVHSTADALTSPTTIIPFPADGLFKMLALTDAMKTDVDGMKTESGGVCVDRGSTCVLAVERFHHFHGELSARLDKENSVYGDTPKPSYFTRVLSSFLFDAPIRHLKDLEAAHMDQVVNQVSWIKLITKLRAEWQDLILYSTLVLNANVALLAVPGSEASPASQVFCYVSICFGLGSIILGLILTRKYRLRADDSITTESGLQSFKTRSLLALESLAILFSLPYVFMIAGMGTFLVGFLVLVMQVTSRAVGIFLLTTALTIGVAISACIVMSGVFSVSDGVERISRPFKFALSRSRPSLDSVGENSTCDSNIGQLAKNDSEV